MAMDDSSYGKHKARTYAWISRASKLLLFTDERCKYTSYNPDMQKLKKPRSQNAYPGASSLLDANVRINFHLRNFLISQITETAITAPSSTIA